LHHIAHQFLGRDALFGLGECFPEFLSQRGELLGLLFEPALADEPPDAALQLAAMFAPEGAEFVCGHFHSPGDDGPPAPDGAVIRDARQHELDIRGKCGHGTIL
jgi:hypothetical protein